MTLHVRIDSIVLEGIGLEPRHATDLRDMISSELARLIAATPPDTWRNPRWIEVRRGETVRVTTPDRLATATARAINDALTGSEA